VVGHLVNINLSVPASTRDHDNASKRLNDFALTLARVAKKSEAPGEVLTTKMASVTTTLRAASEELAQCDDILNWRAPASVHRGLRDSIR